MVKSFFEHPSLIVDKQDYFSTREVGLSHPDSSGFLRLRDNGDIEIVAGDGLAIIMHPHTGTITFVADHINFMTRNQKGLRWNHVAFNDKATTFREPTFLKIDTDQEAYDPYEGIDDFMDDAPEQKHIVYVYDGMGNQVPFEEYVKTMEEQDEDGEPVNNNDNLQEEGGC